MDEFLSKIPSIIVSRGQEYFDNGHILKLHDKSKGTWSAKVSGNYGNYDVEIEADGVGSVRSYSCDCPYDGVVCKHVAAVAIAIIETLTITNIEQQQPHRQNNWEHLIETANADELRSFLRDYGSQNEAFRRHLTSTFSKQETIGGLDTIGYYQNQINGIFEDYEYGGYIDYRHSHKAMRDVNHFLILAEDYYGKENFNEAFSIVAAIAMEGVNAIQSMDDSSGACGSAIAESFEMIGNILNTTDSKTLQDHIFEWLHKQVQNSDYDDYGVGDHLEALFFETAIVLNQLDKAHLFLEHKINELNNSEGWSKKYYLQEYLLQKINLLQSEGKTKEADAIIDEYLDFSKFRQIRVDSALADNDYNQAKGLILKGVEIAGQENESGTIHDWKVQLLEVYKQQGDDIQYRNLARELFVENTSKIAYYRYFKQTIPVGDWEFERNRLIAELRNRQHLHYQGIPLNDMAQILIEEQMIIELLQLVGASNNIYMIMEYTHLLEPEYSVELLGYYKTAIETEANNTGRNEYKALVRCLKKMAGVKGGLLAAKELKESLLQQYKNRPAMREEFQKLHWD
ncbi:hypothetical protein KCTC52924_00724 [Arenibacter antarcticus]|uniref:SWIM zinc finger domain-containing protein n=1 Tax=Arenibacter antarcticus TaxID=2040469 RepID=A0ABW5VCT9_9FLAO|nr:SWIM zinc finger family protein [Arenibacter sp. H213]MCM4169214.1 hypothetical protein [Arenibacter sp. H213]